MAAEFETDDPNDLFLNINMETPEFIDADYKSIIDKLRKTVKKFTMSPKYDSFLSQHTKKKLQLDVKTRWNSLCTMIRSYLDIKTHVNICLVSLNDDILLTQNDDLILKKDC